MDLLAAITDWLPSDVGTTAVLGVVIAFGFRLFLYSKQILDQQHREIEDKEQEIQGLRKEGQDYRKQILELENQRRRDRQRLWQSEEALRPRRY